MAFISEENLDSGSARPPGRPKNRVLDPELITDAALVLLRTSGLRGLTMRGLARQLDVAPSALYNHVASRAAVLAAIQERFAARLDTSGFGTASLRDALDRWAWSYLRQLRERPELVPLIVQVPIAQTPRTSWMYQRVIAGFAAAGWPDESIIASMSILETFIFGSALDFPGPEDVYAPDRRADTSVLNRAYSAYARAVDEIGASQRDAVFSIGLDAILIGLHHRWGSGRGWPKPPLRAQRPASTS
ncbi:MAG TPA: TetR family transcriptional regulator [Marmoricola sp.]|nr:TetR family transcriptional regulator [Marmoricola sp.]